MQPSQASQVQIPFLRRYNLRPRPSATPNLPIGPSWTIDGDNILVTLPTSNGLGTRMRWIQKGTDGPYRVALDGDNIVIFGKHATYFDITMQWVPRQSEMIAQKPALHVDVLRSPSPAPVPPPSSPNATPRAPRTTIRDVFITPPDGRVSQTRPPNAPGRRSAGSHPLVRQQAILNDEMAVEGLLGADVTANSRAGLGNGNGTNTNTDRREMMRNAEFDEEDNQIIRRIEDRRLREIKDEEMDYILGANEVLLNADGNPRSFWQITAELPDLPSESLQREGSVISISSYASTEIVMDDNDNGTNFFDASFATDSTAEVRDVLFRNRSETTSPHILNGDNSISSVASTEIASNDCKNSINNNNSHVDGSTGTATCWPTNRVVRFASPLELSQGTVYAKNPNNSRRVSAPQQHLIPSISGIMAGPGPSSIANSRSNRRRSVPAQSEVLQPPFYIDEEGKIQFRTPKKASVKEIFAEFMET